MNYIWLAVRWIFLRLGIATKFLFGLGKFLPLGLSAIFVATNFIIDSFTQSVPIAFFGAGKTIFMSEIVINEKVVEAIYSPSTYNFVDFVHILLSLYILYALVKFLAKYVFVAITGSQAIAGAIFVSILVVMLFSVIGALLQDGSLGFVPFKDSVWFLIQNIDPVISNIFVKSAGVVVADAISNSTLLNSTLVNYTSNSTLA